MFRSCVGFELKEIGDAASMAFSGYGSVFNVVDSYGDVIVPGAFKDTIAEAKTKNRWPAMLLQHGSFVGGADDMPVGVWTEMEEDDLGLFLEGKFAPTPRGQEAYQLLKMEPRPALDGLSIGFMPIEWSNRAKPEDPKRTLKKVKLFEVSLVNFPANQDSRVLDVKLAGMTDREIERLLIRGGVSRTEARALMRGGLPLLRAMQDAGTDGKQDAAAAEEMKKALNNIRSLFQKEKT